NRRDIEAVLLIGAPFLCDEDRPGGTACCRIGDGELLELLRLRGHTAQNTDGGDPPEKPSSRQPWLQPPFVSFWLREIISAASFDGGSSASYHRVILYDVFTNGRSVSPAWAEDAVPSTEKNLGISPGLEP